MSQQQPGSEPPIARHKTNTPPDEALKYWTADKMRKAKPARQPRVGASGLEKQQTPHASEPSEPSHPHNS